MLCANLLNLEFLFDDDSGADYSVSRYFGLYVDTIDSGVGEISSINNNNVITFGKIDSFCDGKQAFRYYVFLQPHHMKNGAETYHSRYELIKTDKIEKEFVKSIVSKVNVYSNIETWISCANGNDMPYFYR